ncbi:MAG TPA: sulfatase [Porphyromonadaceae bacterium]|jgi:uncharacterized sulfatase|nr:sulfatase [Porphyromonadaceae bacterium]
MSLLNSSLLLAASFNGLAMTHIHAHVIDSDGKRPNVLLVISDDQSFEHTSFAGSNFVSTPGFDKVAQSGIYFLNAYASSPGSAPSRGSMVTGRHHWQNEQSGQHASSWMKKHIPFVDLLAKSGYHTGYTGKGVEPFQYARNENDSLWRAGNAAGSPYNKIHYGSDGVEDVIVAKGVSRLDYFANFKDFLKDKDEDQPFYFWFGSNEPHRGYEKDSWKRTDKVLSMVDVPDFLPDNDEIRGDLLDYAVEIEWYDKHLVKILNYLQEIGELDNTIVIVTADNGMPFPRAKAYNYEYGVHVPLAISYPKSFPANRVSSDIVSFVDIAPTILELAGVSEEGMLPITGKSLVSLLVSKESGNIDKSRNHIFSGRERHSYSRWKNLGFPQRAIRSGDYLFVWNMNPELWPAGDLQAVKLNSEGEIYPLFGIDESGTYHSGWAFTDIDDSPSKSFIIENHNNEDIEDYFNLAFGKVSEFELYNVKEDPYCLENVFGKYEYIRLGNKLRKILLEELERTDDPRIVGPDKDVFDTYKRYVGPMRKFPPH